MTDHNEQATGKHKQDYWSRRQELVYYQYVRVLIEELTVEANSIIDVGSAETPILENLKWIPRRFALDKRNPYSSENVTGIKCDFLKYEPEERFNFALCLQVLEHIDDAELFAKKLYAIADHVLISVPYKWEATACKHHVHDPVDLEKLRKWTGRDPCYHKVIKEPFNSKRRIICYYHPEGKKVNFDYLFKELESQNVNSNNAKLLSTSFSINRGLKKIVHVVKVLRKRAIKLMKEFRP